MYPWNFSFQKCYEVETCPLTNNEVVTSLVYILQTKYQFYMMYEKLKNDVSDNVTCREDLFLKVSN